MDPITLAAIGAGVGGAGNVISSLLNTSSAQSINAAQMGFSIDQAKGSYIPNQLQNMVYGAEHAGLNPLAVLGQKFEFPSLQLGNTSPGNAAAAMGHGIAGVADAVANARAQELQLKSAAADVDLKRTQISNSEIQGERDRYVLEWMKSHADFHPSDVSPPTFGEMGARIGERIADPASYSSMHLFDAPWIQSVSDYFGAGGAYNREVTDALGR